MYLNSDKYLAVDDTQIPIGEEQVENTLFDFREGHCLKDRIHAIDGCGQPGLDHCFVVNQEMSSDHSKSESNNIMYNNYQSKRSECFANNDNMNNTVVLKCAGILSVSNTNSSPSSSDHTINNSEYKRQLHVFTTQPGVQIYTANWLRNPLISPSSTPGTGTLRSGQENKKEHDI